MTSVVMKHTHLPGEGESDGNGSQSFMRSASFEALNRKGGNIARLNPLLQEKDTVWLAGGLPSKLAFPLSSLTVNLFDGSSIVIDDDNDLLGGKTAGNLYLAQQYMRDKAGYQKLRDWCKAHMELIHGELPGHDVRVFSLCFDIVIVEFLYPLAVVFMQETNACRCVAVDIIF